jgi:hypothetical protein
MWTDASPRYLLSWYSPRARFSDLERRWADELAGEAMNGFFELLLDALSLLMAFAPFWRRSVHGFRGRYQFVSSDGDIHTAVTFERSLLFGTRMRVESGSIENPDVKLEFKNGEALYSFLLSGGSDIFSAILDNKLSFSGNINYLLKFAYLSQHVLHLFGPR